MNLRPTESAQSAPATAPIIKAPLALTAAHAGVIATKPATTPDAAPRLVAWPSRIFSTSNQESNAAVVAPIVFRSANPAVPFDATAEPALKPNHPNHKRAAPSITKGKLCGRIGIFPKPTRFPKIRARANPAAPALICTAVPPAKSSAPRSFAIQPPVFATNSSKANTQ